MAEHPIRRRADGPIDIDFYRKHGHELRRRAISDARMPVLRASVLMGCLLVLFAVIVTTSRPSSDAQVARAADANRTR